MNHRAEISERRAPRRAWLRFRLRTLLIVVAIIAIPLAWIASERRRSKYEYRLATSIASDIQVKAMGGPYDAGELLIQSEPQGWWRNVARKVLGDRFLIVTVSRSAENPDAVAKVAEFRRLQFLTVENTTADDIAKLSRLKHLRALIIRNCSMDDVTPLFQLTNVKEIIVESDDVTPEQLQAIQRALPSCNVHFNPFR